jgi:subtilisin family serine protease
VLFDHPDLVDNMWFNEAELGGKPGVDDDGNGFVDDVWGYQPAANRTKTPTDVSGHGTHVAGILGMVHNKIGGRGVGGHIRIMALKAKNDITFEYAIVDLIKAVDYGVKMGATILTTSLGGEPFSKAHEEAIKFAIAKGIPFVCACGNDNKNLDGITLYPPSHVKAIPELIVVCASDPAGTKDYLSNYGKKTATILAPGSNIFSTYVGLNDNDHGTREATYNMLSGTSMAAPFVAGALGLLYSMHPGLLPSEAKARLIQSAKKSSKFTPYSESGGWLDVKKLLDQ